MFERITYNKAIPLLYQIFALCLLIFFAIEFINTSNSIFIFPIFSIISFGFFYTNKKIYIALLILSIFFDIRGELNYLPIQLWEVVAIPLFIFGINKYIPYKEDTLIKFFSLLLCFSVISGLYNHSISSAVKSAFRWIEFITLLNGIRFYTIKITNKQFVIIIFSLSILLTGFAIFQSLFLSTLWNNVLNSDLGSMLLGPDQAYNRYISNNFLFVNDQDFMRASSLYLSAVDLSVIYALTILVILYSEFRYKYIMLIIPIIGLGLTLGRASILIVIIIITFIGIIIQKKAIYILVPAISFIFVLILPPLRDRLFSLMDILVAEGERFLIWSTMINIWKSSPIIGVGGGSIPLLFDKFCDVEWLIGRQATAHSGYLSILVEYGIIGLINWILILSIMLKRAWKSNNYIIISVVLFASLFMFIQDFYPAGSPMFAYFIIIYSFYEKHWYFKTSAIQNIRNVHPCPSF